MKIIILGSNGQLGFELTKKLSKNFEIFSYTKKTLDICNEKDVFKTFAKLKPNIVINAAAFTAVEKAEVEKKLAFSVNAKALEKISKICALQDICLIHYSTDYVFDGRKNDGYQEDDITNPLNTYGLSKLRGEKYINENHKNAYIFRISWLMSAHSHNFIKTILNLANNQKSIKVIYDQIGAPTTTCLVAKVTEDLILSINKKTPWRTGIYHLVPNGYTNWYDMCKIIISEAKKINTNLMIENILPITSDNYPSLARRPLNSCLSNSKLNSVLSFNLPDWKMEFCRVLGKVIENEVQK